MKKITALLLFLALLLSAYSACAYGLYGTSPLPSGSETESIFEMLDSVYEGAMAAALVSIGNEERYVFIIGADGRSMDIFDPKYAEVKNVSFCDSEEMNFQKFYVFFTDALLD